MPSDICGRASAEPLEEGQRCSLGALIAIEERQRLLVGAAKLLPLVRSPAPITRHLESMRLRSSRWRVAQTAAPPEPDRQVPPAIEIMALLCQRKSDRRLGHTACQIAVQPAPFGACRGHGSNTLRLRGGECQIAQFVERR